MKHVSALVLAGTLLPLAGFAAPKVHYQEDFRNYGENPPAFLSSKDISIGNDPIWSCSAEVNVRNRMDSPLPVFRQDVPAPGLTKFHLLFTFRFLNVPVPTDKAPVEQKDFSLTLTAKDGVKTTLVFAPDAVLCNGRKFPLNRSLANRAWEQAALTADGKTLSVYISEDRVMKKIADIPFAGVLTAFNFVGRKNSDFSVSSLKLSDPMPLPAWPVTKHFADFRSRSQKLTSPVTAVPGSSITLNPAPYAGIRIVVGPDARAFDFVTRWSSGKDTRWPVKAVADVRTLPVPFREMKKGAKLTLPDAAILFGGGNSRQYVRPNLKKFQSPYSIVPQWIDIVREWNTLPPASEHVLAIDLVRRAPDAVDLYLDASFVMTLKNDKTKDEIKEIALEFHSDKVQYQLETNRYSKIPAKFYPIDFSANPRAKAFADASLSLKPGVQTIGDIPYDVAAPMDSADVAICKQGQGEWALEVEEYLGRTPLDGFPSAVHFRLPAAPYGKAHLLFALDPDPGKDKILTLRLGQYINNGSGGNLLNDVVLDFSKGVPPAAKQVGTVEKAGVKIPLYQWSVSLNPGAIADLVARENALDFELIGKGWINFEQIDRTMKPDPDSDSAFNVFALTLEKAPVSLDFRQQQIGNVFSEDEADPGTTALIKAVSDNAAGTIAWSAAGIDGKEVFHGSKAFRLAKAGDSAEIAIPFEKVPVGLYLLSVRILDDAGQVLFDHPARFAILGKDDRKASRTESPFAVWWFKAHGSPGAMNIGGPLMNKAGIRKCSANFPSQDAVERYNIINTGNLMAPNIRNFDVKTGQFKPSKIRVPDPANPKKWIMKEISGEEWFVKTIRNSMQPWGYYDHILIWHESSPGYGIPEELLGMPVANPEQAKADQKIAAYVNETGRLIRKHFPNLKIQLGNTSSSIGAIVRPFRAGVDPQYYDYIGIETPSQVVVPEKLQEVGLQGMRITADAASHFTQGKKEIKLNGTWEFVYRCERDMGEQQQAEWYARDVLISLANNFFLISPGLLFDCKSGYYNGLWGQSGLITRSPYVYPKRAYVAYAALTKTFDRVNFSRQLDTGSTTVYALEFKRADGQFAYAFWASRGFADFTLAFPAGTAGKSVTMYGRETPFRGESLTLNAGTSPAYVISGKPLVSLNLSNRTFPKDTARASAMNEAYKFASADEVEVKPDLSMESKKHQFLPILKPAPFTVGSVKDDEKGDVLEVRLTPEKETAAPSHFITRYTTIRLKNPAPIPGSPAAVGVWIKGDSNWGQIRFEIEDAQGEVFKNLTTSGWGCDIMDWPGNLSVNFDGWCFVAQPLFPTKLFHDHSPGPVSEQWVSEGGDKKIDLPVKLRAVTVGVNPVKLNLLDFEPSAGVLRLGAVGGMEEN